MARYRRWNIILSFQLYFPVRRKYFFSSEEKIFVCVVEKIALSPMDWSVTHL